MKKQKYIPLFFILLFLAVCYFPLFLHLDQLPLRLWDEGRRAVNAFEMAQNGNFLVTHYAGEPEMWGTKPPFLIWCQVFWIKILGYNELAIRLPAALAGLATILGLVFFSHKILKRPIIGIFAGLVLLTTRGYISEHMTRSGDFDALLTLWTTGFLLVFFVWSEIKNHKSLIINHKSESTEALKKTEQSHDLNRGLRKLIHSRFQMWDFPKSSEYFIALLITLAALTKSIAAFFFLPGMFLYALFQKQLIPILKSKHTWFAVLGVLFAVGGFYVLREQFNPGYLEAVWENELGGRYFKSKEGHNHAWYLYFKILYEKGHFMPWILFLPLGIFAGLFRKGKLRNLTVLILINTLTFFLILMAGKTKIQWYVAPIFPSLALVIGMGLNVLFEGGWRWLNSSGNFPSLDEFNLKKALFLSIFTLTFFFQPYQKTIERIYFEKLPEHDWKFMKYRDFTERNEKIKNYTIVHRRFNSHIQFYRSVRNLNGYDIKAQPLEDFEMNKYEFGKGKLKFEPGDTLMICEKKVFPQLDKVYEYDVLNGWDICKMLVIR